MLRPSQIEYANAWYHVITLYLVFLEVEHHARQQHQTEGGVTFVIKFEIGNLLA